MSMYRKKKVITELSVQTSNFPLPSLQMQMVKILKNITQ
jgi:hypothetical protein